MTAQERGTGTVVQRGDGYQCRWWVKIDGVWKQRTKQKPTLTEARKYLREQISLAQKGEWTEARDKALTFSTFVDDHWLPAMRTEAARGGRTRRDSTRQMYEDVCDAWLTPYIGKTRLVDITPKVIEGVLAKLRASGRRGSKPLSDRSVQAAYGVLKASLDFAVRSQYIVRNPAGDVGRPGATEREMESWTGDEARRFLTAARDDRLFAAWALLVTRGLRRGELCGLTWDALDLDSGTARITATRIVIGTKVVASTPKTAAGRRMIHLDAMLIGILKDHRKRQLQDRLAWGAGWVDSGLVVVREDGEPIDPAALSARFDRLCALHGARRIPLHSLRHTAASLALAAGTPVKVVSEMIGHSDPAVTMKIYQHITPAMHADAGARLSGQLLGGPS
jgi:integrase